MRVLLGIPTAGSPAQPFLAGLATLKRPAEVDLLGRIVVTGNFVPGQREMLVSKAAAARADVLVMIDDDIVLPPDTLIELIAALKGDDRIAIAGVLYYSRDGKRPMVVSRWSSSDTTGASVPAFGSQGLTFVDGIGFGCVAIRMAALAPLEEPIFATQIAFNDVMSNVRLCNEDYLLCERLRAHGWRIALHGGLRAGHYDRAGDVIHPIAWEPDGVTAVERMFIRDGDGVDKLVPYDGTVAQVTERHCSASLDYLYTIV